MRTLETPRLILRPLLPDDESFYCRLHGDADVMRHIAAPLTPEAASRVFQRTLAHNRDPRGCDRCWAIVTRASADVVGLIGLRHLDDAACAGSGEIGILLVTHAQGCGYAREAIPVLAEHAFRYAHLARVVLAHFPANSRMAVVAFGLGFAPVASAEPPSPRHCRWELRHVS